MPYSITCLKLIMLLSSSRRAQKYGATINDWSRYSNPDFCNTTVISKKAESEWLSEELGWNEIHEISSSSECCCLSEWVSASLVSASHPKDSKLLLELFLALSVLVELWLSQVEALSSILIRAWLCQHPKHLNIGLWSFLLPFVS